MKALEMKEMGMNIIFFLVNRFNTTLYDMYCKYHQTLLKELGGVALDGGRYFTPCPEIDGITLDKNNSFSWIFHIGILRRVLSTN